MLFLERTFKNIFESSTCEDISLLNSHHASRLLIIRWRSCKMSTELIVWVVFVLKGKGRLMNADFMIDQFVQFDTSCTRSFQCS